MNFMAVEINPAAEKSSIHLPPAKLLYEIIELCLVSIGIVAMLLLLPRRLFLDGNVRLRAVISLLQHGTVSHMSYSFVGPIFSTPLLVIDRLTGSPSQWQGRYNI